MASSLKCVTIILLVAFYSSMQVFARDSQFFNKVTKNNVNNDKETTTMNQINNNEYKQEQVDEDPLFVPESETGGYALYGHESGQLPPSTTYEPYTTVATGYVPRQEKTSTGVQFSQETYNNNNYYNRNTYDANHPQETNMGDTSFAEKTYTTNNNNNNDQESQNINSYRQQFVNNNNNNNKQYNNEKQGMSDTRFLENGKYHYDLKNENQRQGMSDTRFMENGKYFYDVKNENTYNPNQYHENSYSKGSGSVSYNNNNGGGYNYGNHNNNGNTYEYNNNNMAEFQNAEVDEDNFNDEQFEP